MAKKIGKQNHLTKNGAKEQVVKALETSLGDLCVALGKKKFNKRVKQASRLLTNGLPKTDKAKTPKAKKIVIDTPATGLIGTGDVISNPL